MWKLVLLLRHFFGIKRDISNDQVCTWNYVKIHQSLRVFSHNEAKRNGRHICRWHIQMHFPERKGLHFDQNFSDVCFWVAIENKPALVQIMAWCQICDYIVIIGTIAGSSYWRIYASLLNGLRQYTSQCASWQHCICKASLGSPYTAIIIPEM